jgi:hypothetical protein
VSDPGLIVHQPTISGGNLRMINDITARKALHNAQIQARRQWLKDGARCDLAEYEDAGMAALTGCLARYDPHRGPPFTAYAQARLIGAIQDASQGYRIWQQCPRPGRSRPALPAHILRPHMHPEPDPLLRQWFLQQIPMLSACDGQMLRGILAGETLSEIAEAAGLPYNAIYQRYRHLLSTLRKSLLVHHPDRTG